MATDLLYEFTADRAAATMLVRREFAAGRQLVWDCHTRADLLDRWFAPAPLTTETRSMDFAPGGHWHYAMLMPDGEKYWSRLDYISIDPINGYDATDAFSDETGAVNRAMPVSKWEVRFTDLGQKTLVETFVIHDSAESLDQVVAMGMEEGMKGTMEKLDLLLAELAPGAA